MSLKYFASSCCTWTNQIIFCLFCCRINLQKCENTLQSIYANLHTCSEYHNRLSCAVFFTVQLFFDSMELCISKRVAFQKCIPNPRPVVIASPKVLVSVQAHKLFHKWMISHVCVLVFMIVFCVDSAARCRASPSLHCISCHELVPAVFSGGLVSPRHETKGSHSQGPQTTQVCTSIISLSSHCLASCHWKPLRIPFSPHPCAC